MTVFNWGYPTPASVDFDDEQPDVPKPGSATTVIKDKQQVMFYSIEWVMTATVNDKVIAESTPKNSPHSAGEMAQWSRAMYRRYVKQLVALGVDVEREYSRAGGFTSELDK